MSDDPDKPRSREPVLHEQREAPRGERRRRAAVADETSDVTRFRGVALAAAVAALTAVVGLLASYGVDGLRSPGPMARPHATAGLACDNCHRGDEPAARACANCHGAHASRRPAHQELRAAGQLPCTRCHSMHRADEGVAFGPDGRVIRYGTGWEVELPSTLAFRPNHWVSVPLVPARACTGCHDPTQPSDPVAGCLIAGQESLGLDRPTVCFDEHRSVSTITGAAAKVAPGASTERDAAWEAARTVVALHAGTRPVRASVGRPAAWLGGGVAVGLMVLLLVRIVGRRRRRVAPAAPVRAASVVRLPQVDTSTCIGCSACVDACPYDVLEMQRYVAVVARPDDCCGLTLCEQRCPNGSLVVRDGEPIEDRPRVTDDLESVDVPGLHLAGDLTGLPLIRNAINQGAHAMRSMAEALKRERGKAGRDVHDVIVVGAGPAGISAGLEAKRLGLDCLLLEQSTVAASIKSFPRGKLVFDQPLGVPLVGELWLEESSKEELLGKWLRIVRREKLVVEEGRRVEAVTRDGADFLVTARDPDDQVHRYRARRVLLAVGRRGSPRLLDAPIAAEAEAHVHYSLADAQSFADQRVLIVGLGDTAMECAVALCGQGGTEVVISYRGSEFRRGKARNISEVKRLEREGRLRIEWQSHVERIEGGRALLRTPTGMRSVPVDAVLVLIGALAPWRLLESAGVARHVVHDGQAQDGDTVTPR